MDSFYNSPHTNQPFNRPDRFHGSLLWLLGIWMVVMVLLLGWLFLTNPGDPLVIGSADNITITADQSSPLGVDIGTTFHIESKDPLTQSELKSALSIEPPIDFKLADNGSNKFLVTPANTLEVNKIYQFKVSTIGDRELSWAFQTEAKFKVTGSIPRNEARFVPIDSAIEVTFSSEDFEDPQPYFNISPATDGHFERYKRTVVFVPDQLLPRTLYKVTISKDLKVKDSNAILGEDFVVEFETNDYQSSEADFSINFDRSIAEFPPSEKPALAVQYYPKETKPAVDVEIYKFKDDAQFLKSLTDSQLAKWSRYNQTKLYPVNGLTKVASFAVNIEGDEYQEYVVFPEPLDKGFYLINAKANNQVFQAWLESTNLAAYAATSKTDTLIWINSVSEQKPVNGAKISFSGGNLEQSSGDDGVSRFPTPSLVLDNKRTYYYSVTSGNETIIIPAHDSEYYYDPGEGDNYWSYLYLDRPWYQPTDTIKFWGTLEHRDKPGQKLDLDVTLVRSDYSGGHSTNTIMHTQKITTGSMGTFIGEIPIKNAQTGGYSVEVKVGEDSVIKSYLDVETFIKPAYRITVSADKKAIISGETTEVKGEVVFQEGTPVANIDLEYHDDQSDQKKPIQTDAAGKFQFNFINPSEYDSRISVTPKNSEEGEISGSAYVRVFDSAIELRADKKAIDGKQQVAVTANNVDLSRINNGTNTDYDDYLGSPIANQKIVATLVERNWEKKETGSYYDFIDKVVKKRYEYNLATKEVEKKEIVTDNVGQAVYEFTPATDKSNYEVGFAAKDASGRTEKETEYIYTFRGLNEQDSYILDDDDDRSSSSYKLNEDINLTLKRGSDSLPEGGSNHYLFYFGSRGLRDYKTSIKPTANFKYQEQFVPNAVARSVYFNGKTFYESEVVYVNFDEKAKKLTINATKDREEYKPRESAVLNLQTLNSQNQGTKSLINVSIVDNAIFNDDPEILDPVSSVYKSVEDGIIGTYASHQYPLGLPGAERGGCFLAGTQILLPNGKSKNIKDVKVGDVILTKQSVRSTELVPAKVTRTFEHKVAEYLTINGYLRVTPEHVVYSNGEWKTAERLRIGDYLLKSDGSKEVVVSMRQDGGLFDVYNLEVAEYATYFANDIYVHNCKGGGNYEDCGRSIFPDRIFFDQIETDRSGKAQVRVNLPDNLTSWRATLQAVGSQRTAGGDVELIPVRLPFFVSVITNEQYLIADKPIIKLRSFGKGLGANDNVDFTVNAQTLGIVDQKLSAKAFETGQFELKNLIEGEHFITVEAKTGDYTDKVSRRIKVVSSRLSRLESSFEPLESSTRFNLSSSATLVFSNEEAGRYYQALTDLSISRGDRIDQLVSAIGATNLLDNVFGENAEPDQTNSSPYQASDGGIGLLPYGSSDLEISAKIAAINSDLFDREALRNYFAEIVDSKTESAERLAVALFGLAALGEPVLAATNSAIQKSDQQIKTELYLALASADLGNRQIAKQMLEKILNEFGQKVGGGIRIKVSQDDEDAIITQTALGAVLASMLGHETADDLYQYVLENGSSYNLYLLERLLVIKNQLAKLSANEVSFNYSLDGKGQDVVLDKNQTHKIRISVDQLKDLRFSDIKGRVGVTALYSQDIAKSDTSSDVSITRAYEVSGKTAVKLKESDLVKVTLNPQISAQAPDGCYQVADILPSGLAVITRPYARAEAKDKSLSYPYSVDGQKVSFCIGKDSPKKKIEYLARVVNAGEFYAEPALIQSLKFLKIFNLTKSQIIKIESQ